MNPEFFPHNGVFTFDAGYVKMLSKFLKDEDPNPLVQAVLDEAFQEIKRQKDEQMESVLEKEPETEQAAWNREMVKEAKIITQLAAVPTTGVAAVDDIIEFED